METKGEKSFLKSSELENESGELSESIGDSGTEFVTLRSIRYWGLVNSPVISALSFTQWLITTLLLDDFMHGYC